MKDIYKIEIGASAQKEMRKIFQEKIRDKIIEQIFNLRENPHTLNSEKMVGYEGYRLRIGNYRVLYEIEKSAKVIFIVKVGHRKEVYKNL